MLKITTTHIVIFALLLLPFSQPLFAQSQVPMQRAETVTQRSPDPIPNLKEIIAQNEKRHRDSLVPVDVKTLEKLDRQQPKKGSGFTTKQKVWVVLGVIGFAALIFVLIKYGKECKTTSPTYCTLGGDEPCTCTEYAPSH